MRIGTFSKKMTITIRTTTEPSWHRLSSHSHQQETFPDTTFQDTPKPRLISFTNVGRRKELQCTSNVQERTAPEPFLGTKVCSNLVSPSMKNRRFKMLERTGNPGRAQPSKWWSQTNPLSAALAKADQRGRALGTHRVPSPANDKPCPLQKDSKLSVSPSLSPSLPFSLSLFLSFSLSLFLSFSLSLFLSFSLSLFLSSLFLSLFFFF